MGSPLELPLCGGYLITRRIPHTTLVDAMGPYPLFSCADWRQLGSDLAGLEARIVSVVMVADPFGKYSEEMLRDCFPDLIQKFKEHLIVDFRKPWQKTLPENHRRNVKRALKTLRIVQVPKPSSALADWKHLYGALVERHGIRGHSAFSEESFAAQLEVPGVLAFRAELNGETVGMALWIVDGDVGYYHLAAYNDIGYRSRASFGIFWEALHYLERIGVRRVNLGANAGSAQDAENGLLRFKRGWANDSLPAWLCGRILDRKNYVRICESRNFSSRNFFPAYRATVQ